MAHFIIKIKDKYFIWSSVVDAPITLAMDAADLADYIREEYGQQGLDALAARMERIEKKGTSALRDGSVEETIACNRAGPRETTLTADQIYERYLH